MAAIRRFVIMLGESIDPFRHPDYERYIPTQWRGKSIQQRAAMTIAEGFNEGYRAALRKYPGFLNEQKASEKYSLSASAK